MDFALLPLYQKQPEKEAEQQIQNSPWRWIILWDNSVFFEGRLTGAGLHPSLKVRKGDDLMTDPIHGIWINCIVLIFLIIYMCRKPNFWVMQVNKAETVTSSGNGGHNITQVLSLALTCTPTGYIICRDRRQHPSQSRNWIPEGGGGRGLK